MLLSPARSPKCGERNNSVAEVVRLRREPSYPKSHDFGYMHDFRDMLKEKDLDIVLIGTPDHWHALQMIAAVEAGADVYVQKPISVDVVEGEAMLAAARKTNRVVQVGTQRRSTPHLIEARDRIIKEGKLGKVAPAEVNCYYHMRAAQNPPDTNPPQHPPHHIPTRPPPPPPHTHPPPPH